MGPRRTNNLKPIRALEVLRQVPSVRGSSSTMPDVRGMIEVWTGPGRARGGRICQAHESFHIRSAGSVQCWGFNLDGELGAGPQSAVVASPQTILTPAGFDEVAAGG